MATYRYAVIDVGCLECGIDHRIVGTYGTVEAAHDAALAAGLEDRDSQHEVLVIDLAEAEWVTFE